MQTTILGLGGGGIRVATEYLEWLKTFQTIREVDPDTREVDSGWLFGKEDRFEDMTQVETAFGFAMIDSNSGDMDFLRRGAVPWQIPYTISDEQGFAGDLEKAYTTILEQQRNLEDSWRQYLQAREDYERAQNILPEPQVPDAVPIVGKLGHREQLGLGYSDAVLACTSLLGGSGRGAFEYICAYWNEIFDRGADVLNMLVGVIPAVEELESDRYRSRVIQYIKNLNEKVNHGHITGVILVNFDMARAIFNAEYTRCNSMSYREHRPLANSGVLDGNFENYKKAVRELRRLCPYPAVAKDGLRWDREADAGIVVATAPIFANSISPLIKNDGSVEPPSISYPKHLDTNDVKEHFANSFVVPCYTGSRIPPGKRLAEEFEEYKGYYRDNRISENILDDDVSYSSVCLLAHAIESGSFVPIDVSNTISKAFAAVWISPDYTYEDIKFDDVTMHWSTFMREMYEITDFTTYQVSGLDLVNDYIRDRFDTSNSEIILRIWVYLCGEDGNQVAGNALELMATG